MMIVSGSEITAREEGKSSDNMAVGGSAGNFFRIEFD
jgi:hypothetical protein